MIQGSTAPYRSPRTFTVANIADPDSIKASIATAATAQSYSGAALNGASKKPLPDSKTGFAQWPTATASNSAGSYVNGSKIVFTSTYKGYPVVRTATVVGANGNATFVADGPVDGDVTLIAVGAQANAAGAWTFGFADLECPSRSSDKVLEPWRHARGTGAGNIGVVNLDGSAEVLPCLDGEHHSTEIYRLKTSTTTVTSVTLYQ